jgi:hypothetical protein
MTHELGHIECGGVGPKLGKKTIEIEDHEGLNLAVHLKRRHEWSEKEFQARVKKIEKLRHKMYEVAMIPGDEVHYYDKHAE